MSRSDPVVAVVPVREGSTRIADKNFQPFGDAPTLVHHKLRQLRAAGCFDAIYVSSDSQRAAAIARECEAIYLPRDPVMCTGTPRWDEVVVSILNDIPGDPHVGWAMVTSPCFAAYRPAVERYLAGRAAHDSLVAVKKVREYLIDEHCRPLFTGFGIWHPYTTEIKPLYAISDAFFLARKSDQLLWRYWIGRTPVLHEIAPIEAIDVNFAEDLDLAKAAQEYLTKHAKG